MILGYFSPSNGCEMDGFRVSSNFFHSLVLRRSGLLPQLEY